MGELPRSDGEGDRDFTLDFFVGGGLTFGSTASWKKGIVMSYPIMVQPHHYYVFHLH